MILLKSMFNEVIKEKCLYRKEAEIVSLTFDLYLLNVGSSRIGEVLDYLGVKTVTGTT